MRDEQAAGDDAGFGMVEIVVALFMLAVLAIAFLPLLVQGLQLSAENATRATATQIAQDRLEVARTQSTSCSAIKTALESDIVSLVKDPRGIEFKVKTVVGTCPAALTTPGTISVKVEVRRTDDAAGTPLVTASTLLFIKTV